ncbi:MAG: sulfotransferase [Actinomycetota bacterium]|nr:sulfotransferase [Actinomycetota bacterium]
MSEVFPFFVGCERSGTTLLSSMFDSHPEIAVPYESYFIPDLVDRRGRYERNGGFDLDAFINDIVTHWWFPTWRLPEDLVRRELPGSETDTLEAAIRSLYALYAQHRGKPRYAEKTPRYVFYIPMLADLFPEARFVHLVRDGRDVALSLVDRDWGPANVTEASVFWRHHVQRGRAGGRVVGPARYREIRYEDLLDAPETVVRELCDFLNLRFDDEMLRYFERSGELLGSTRNPREHQSLALPPTQGLRDWRTQMDRKDLLVFEIAAGRTLTEFGYPVETEDPDVMSRTIARLRAWFGVGTFQARRVGHRLERLLRARGLLPQAK